MKARQVEALVVLKLGDEFMTQFGQDRADSEGQIRVSVADKLVLWVSDAVKHLQMRLIVCAHTHPRGSRSQPSTLHILEPYCT